MSNESDRPVLRIATRESPLALWQASFVADEIRKYSPGTQVELVPVSTLGDRDRQATLAGLGGQGVFTREVQRAVLDHQADLAVHSLKDLPTEAVAGLTLAGVPARGPRFDALVLPQGTSGSLELLPAGARIGTGSPRRVAQLLRARPDLVPVEIRGNVETRLRKTDDGEFAAIVLAQAGLQRLNLADRLTQPLVPPLMYPAPGQAALGIECRASDTPLQQLLQSLTDPITWAEVLAERACLRHLRAGCHAPLGVLTTCTAAALTLEAVVLSPDGSTRYQARADGPMEQPEELGIRVAEELIQQGAPAVL